jgi:hypothetical protein
LYRRAAEIVIEGESIVLNKEEKKEEDNAID